MRSTSPGSRRRRRTASRRATRSTAWGDLYGWITAEDAAMLFLRLREVEDRPEWFPKGKSATVQRIEQMLIGLVRAGMAA